MISITLPFHPSSSIPLLQQAFQFTCHTYTIYSFYLHKLCLHLLFSVAMPESNQVFEYDETFNPFAGVRFLLLGFDSVKKEKILSRLLTGGGIDAVNYGPNCTHVIVDKLVCDDSICVAALGDGKTLVTGIWVDHSFDVGMPVDPTSVIYRPVKDFNGILGAQSFIICLTGYQRQDRDDIMIMVGLMGAIFSKPLIASKVTHLICYKFEGEKYELAKKIKKIKLVNHRWLEECLKAWEILPESDYSKSGYELEMEAEAKDSQEETEDVASIVDTGRKNMVSPKNPVVQDKGSHQSPLKPDNLGKSLYLTESRSWTNVGNDGKAQSTSGKEIYSDNVPLVREECHMNLDIFSPFSSRSPRKISTLLPSTTPNTTVISQKVENFPASATDSANKFPSVSKSCSKSDDRNISRKSTLPLRSEKTEANAVNPSSSNADKILVSSGFNMQLETHPDEIDFEELETPKRGTMLHPEKRKTATLSDQKIIAPKSGVSFSPRVNHSSKTLMESESTAKILGELASGSSFDSLHEQVDQVSTANDIGYLRKEASRTLEYALNISRADMLKDEQEYNKEAIQPSSKEGKKKSFSNSYAKDLPRLSLTKYSFGEVEMHQNDIPGVEPVSLGTNLPMSEKSKDQDDLPCSKLEHPNLEVKPLKRKMLVKKTLGSKASICKGNTKKHAGAMKLVKVVPQNENRINSEIAAVTKDTDKLSYSGKIVVPPTDKYCSKTTQIDNLPGSLEKATGEDGTLHDEIKVPENKGELEFDKTSSKENSVEVGASDPGSISPGNRAGVNNDEKQSRTKITRTKEKLAKSGEDKCIAGAVKGYCSEKIKSTELLCATETREVILAEGKKHPLRGTKRNKMKVPRKEDNKNESNTGQTKQISIASNEDTVTLNGKTNIRSFQKFKSSAGAEKENVPVTASCQDPRNDTGASDKVVAEPVEKHLKNKLKNDKARIDPIECGQNLEVKTEAARFIFSGHKLQRKEFQKVIKQLKGRVCRDSHHWSYEATHFVVPSPVRRTEKFFAAAASGSWILKTDYLTASNEAGRLLSEEPFEWHTKCLSEDGAINLEAPRKWRHLRERTGHGAFHGMRVVVYGECIAPPLDTMKRVVKAGGGTVLATSPPYTRFLQSRIDFAIVSPGMPRVDMWVQEFLRHEIPCVVADYLVEYVCKPGYSLERHVQYGSHGWAKKSVDNLVRCVEDPRTPVDDGVEVTCHVCGSGERGEELLICGDESGGFGCGTGTHIDCLHTPLAEVPEEDWFCASCCKKREGQVPSKRSTKRKKW